MSIEQRLPGQAKNAILAVLGADLYMKRVVVVDHDVDVFDDRQVNWAIATRCQPDRDITIITHARGSDLDPSTREDGYTAKWGVDATAKPSPGRLHAAPPGAARGVAAPAPRGLPRLNRRVSENFAGLIAAVARRHPDRIALCWDDGALSYGELIDRRGRLRPPPRAPAVCGRASGWRSRWPTVPSSSPSCSVGIAAGAIVAPLDVLLKPDERAAILADLRPTRLVERGPRRLVEHAMAGGAAPAASRAALVLYTSGSTGRPKGAVLSHAARWRSPTGPGRDR